MTQVKVCQDERVINLQDSSLRVKFLEPVTYILNNNSEQVKWILINPESYAVEDYEIRSNQLSIRPHHVS